MAAAENAPPDFRGGADMSTGKIVIRNIDGRLYLRWFLDRVLSEILGLRPRAR